MAHLLVQGDQENRSGERGLNRHGGVEGSGGVRWAPGAPRGERWWANRRVRGRGLERWDRGGSWGTPLAATPLTGQPIPSFGTERSRLERSGQDRTQWVSNFLPAVADYPHFKPTIFAVVFFSPHDHTPLLGKNIQTAGPPVGVGRPFPEMRDPGRDTSRFPILEHQRLIRPLDHRSEGIQCASPGTRRQLFGSNASGVHTGSAYFHAHITLDHALQHPFYVVVPNWGVLASLGAGDRISHPEHLHLLPFPLGKRPANRSTL